MTTNDYMRIAIRVLIPVAAGSVVATTQNILIFASIQYPQAQKIEMNDTEFHNMAITALVVGFTKRPPGPALFEVSGTAGESIPKTACRAMPFVFIMRVFILMTTDTTAFAVSLLPDVYQ